MLKNIILIALILLSSCQNFVDVDSSRLAFVKEELNRIQLPKAKSKYIVIFNNAFANIYSSNELHKDRKNSSIAESGHYQLNVDFSFGSAPLLIRKNSDLMRENIVLNVNFILSSNSIVVDKGSFSLQSANDIVDSPYANYVENESIKIQLVEQAAFKIHKYLMVYFLNLQNTSKL